ncbi:hypothetical protein, partial [Aliidiomarina quisquiliarum]|uniref:hypothetical protein n=1 Tax=Aliidiomarina quisquiliarum TaxID=2938947 RepID=UPI00208FF1FF
RSGMTMYLAASPRENNYFHPATNQKGNSNRWLQLVYDYTDFQSATNPMDSSIHLKSGFQRYTYHFLCRCCWVLSKTLWVVGILF